MNIPWELRYLFTPRRWFGEGGLIDLHTWTAEQGHRWIIDNGLICPLTELGVVFDSTPISDNHYAVLHIGSYQWKWVKAPGDRWRFRGFRNLGRN
jgi:hypothetical protein